MAWNKSISWRLFAWLFWVGLLALLLGGGGLYLEVRNIIYSSLDHTLQSELEIFTGLLHIEDGELEFEYAETVHSDYIVPRSGHYFQVYIDGFIIADSLSLVGEKLLLSPERLVDEVAEREVKIYQGTGPANEPLRLHERSFVFGGHRARVIVGQSTFDSEQMLARFRTFLWASGVLGVLCLALLGLVISRRSLQPLQDFSGQIAQIGERNLEQRLSRKDQYLEITHLADAFNAMLERLQRSFKNREELLSEVSHQLKTPVAVIRSHCDIYLQQERTAAEYIEALENIRESADTMGLKIRRLLGIAQAEADLMSSSGLDDLDLRSCLQQALTTVEPLAREPGISFSESYASGLLVRGNRERLVEAFANLLENAVKYNNPGGRVDISLRRSQKNAIISIADTGPGIEQNHLERIFERFFRADLPGQADGNGLGLALVKTIITAHLGQIEVTNRAEGGCCFIVTLPLAGSL